MKKLIMSLLCILLAASFAYAAEPSSFKTAAGDLNVELIFEEGHIHLGKNHVSIIIRNASGNMVKDASVKLEYGMPPMKNAAPVNYRARTEFKGEEYEAEVNLPMKGNWFVDAKILMPEGKVLNARFDFPVTEDYHKEKNGHDHGHEHDNDHK